MSRNSGCHHRVPLAEVFLGHWEQGARLAAAEVLGECWGDWFLSSAVTKVIDVAVSDSHQCMKSL